MLFVDGEVWKEKSFGVKNLEIRFGKFKVEMFLRYRRENVKWVMWGIWMFWVENVILEVREYFFVNY